MSDKKNSKSTKDSKAIPVQSKRVTPDARDQGSCPAEANSLGINKKERKKPRGRRHQTQYGETNQTNQGRRSPPSTGQVDNIDSSAPVSGETATVSEEQRESKRGELTELAKAKTPAEPRGGRTNGLR